MHTSLHMTCDLVFYITTMQLIAHRKRVTTLSRKGWGPEHRAVALTTHLHSREAVRGDEGVPGGAGVVGRAGADDEGEHARVRAQALAAHVLQVPPHAAHHVVRPASPHNLLMACAGRTHVR